MKRDGETDPKYVRTPAHMHGDVSPGGRLIDQQRRQSTPSAQVISLEEARLEHRSPDDYGVDVARTLARGIAALPREQQDVVVLKVVEGRRFAEIAAQLGVSEEACRARLSRALRTLRADLEKEGITP